MDAEEQVPDPQSSPDRSEPLAADVRRRLERMLGRSLAGVRVQDDAQAEQLTQALGASAFAVGRRIYMRHGRGHSPNPADVGLLAHEATHVVQQTNPAALPGSPPALAHRPVVQRRTSSLSATEEQATQTEVAAQTPAPAPAPAPIDPDMIANRVYDLIAHDLRVERERRCGY